MELNCVTNLDTHAVEEGAAVSTLDKAADDGANAETGDTAVRMSALPADRGISSLPESRGMGAARALFERKAA